MEYIVETLKMQFYVHELYWISLKSLALILIKFSLNDVYMCANVLNSKC